MYGQFLNVLIHFAVIVGYRLYKKVTRNYVNYFINNSSLFYILTIFSILEYSYNIMCC